MLNCADSWIVHNPDWEVALLSDGNISEYVTLNDFIKGGNITYAAYSDVVRIKLLSKYGGCGLTRQHLQRSFKHLAYGFNAKRFLCLQ